MVGRLTMSACAGQRTSGEASGWVWWSSSRTDWNHGHGCSHGDGASQPKQQGSMVQLLNIISSPVPLRACGARLGASAQLEHAARHDEPPVSGMHTSCGSATVMVLVGDSQGPSIRQCTREVESLLRLWAVPFIRIIKYRLGRLATVGSLSPWRQLVV